MYMIQADTPKIGSKVEQNLSINDSYSCFHQVARLNLLQSIYFVHYREPRQENNLGYYYWLVQ